MVIKARAANAKKYFFAKTERCSCSWTLLFTTLALLIAASCQTATSAPDTNPQEPQWPTPASTSAANANPALVAALSTNTNAAPAASPDITSTNTTGLTSLREGDVIRVTFPGAPNLTAPSQQIRQDGNITLPLIGEVKASGKTPAELEKDLSEQYKSQLVDSRVTVTVDSSSYAIYVSGSVLHPGKVTSSHPLTALQAVMEAGGPDTHANMKKVRIIRQEGNSTTNIPVNLQKVLDGDSKVPPFYLKPSDIVVVPEAFKVLN